MELPCLGSVIAFVRSRDEGSDAARSGDGRAAVDELEETTDGEYKERAAVG